jgi:hypothetical protein
MPELPEWPETRGLAVSTSYEDRKYSIDLSTTVKIKPPSSNKAGHFSLQPLWTQLAYLTADSLGHGELAGGLPALRGLPG